MCCNLFHKREVINAPVIIMTCPFFDRVDDKLIEVENGWVPTDWFSGHRRIVYLRCKLPITKKIKYQLLTKFFHHGSFELDEVEYIDLTENRRHVHVKIHTTWNVSKRNGVFMTCLVQVCGGKNRKLRAESIRQDQYLKRKEQLDQIYFRRKK